MATLVLAAAGQAVGALFGPVGAIVGKAAGALAGYAIDQRLFGETSTRTVGRIDDLSVQTASEGNPIARVYGRVRLAGTVIWSTDFVEHVNTEQTGGKGGGGTVVKEYTYTVSFAVGIAEGPVARIGRIWADGIPLDLSGIEVRTYLGTEDQEPDPLIEATEAVCPAYRGLAYVVFQDLPVGPFGNRLPQLTFEVIRPVGDLERHVRAVTLIPGATEFGYDPEPVKVATGPGSAVGDNIHVGVATSDIVASLDELMAVCPNLERVALVVAWFGTDLRAANCRVLPKVEMPDRPTDVAWTVAGVDRGSAEVVSATVVDGVGRPNYGGTPSDLSVFRAIAELKRRGLKVTFYPFLMMDIPAGNGKPDPYGGGEQARFPWRGRITLAVAPGRPGSSDATAAAAGEIAAFVGHAQPGQFGGDGGEVEYDGPAEWSFRRMVLHYAELVRQAGGVDAFLIGSELRGLTTARSAIGYPFVDALVELVGDVRSIVGPAVKLSYAADWSEYFGHQVGGEVHFHLDPLWTSPAVDFVGIDNYWPLADWRDGQHADEAVATDTYDGAYLQRNVAGGEGYDWYYASDEDRRRQVRTPIADGAYGKPWVFRYKDLASWWNSPHYDRVGGTEVATPTAWQPGMKPVWFTEVGCPAIDRGANQPNVFFDPKSAESALPHFSSGRRDDQMQRSYLEAVLTAFDPARGPDVDRINPASSVYAGRMVDPETTHIWTWDARPWPAFPQLLDVWSDGANWERGHWLNGRLGGLPFRELVAALSQDWGLPAPSVEGVPVVLDGFLVSAPSSLRAVLEPLLAAVSAVAADTGTEIRIVGYGGRSVAEIGAGDVVDTGRSDPLVVETREEAQNLPIEVRLRYLDSGNEFQVASARYRPPAGSTRQIETIQVSAALNDGLATELCEIALTVRLEGRTTIKFALPPSRLALTPGDVVTLNRDGILRDLLIEEVSDVLYREITARTVDRGRLAPTPTPGSPTPPIVPPTLAPPVAFGLNLPRVDPEVADHVPFLAVYADPFPTMGVWRAVPGGAFQLIRTVVRPTTAGQVVRSPGDGFLSRWDYGARMDVRLFRGRATSEAPEDVLAGANALAVRSVSGLWEIISYQQATLIGEDTYRLDTLLRGRLGTNDAIDDGILAGAPLVLLDGSLATIPLSVDELRLRRTYRVGPLSEGVGGRNVTTFEFIPTGRGLTPWSPVHGEALLVSGGTIRIGWIRRTRVGGDSWGPGDVPLGETAEQYRLEILSGTTTVRTVVTASPAYSYSLAEQTADFGAARRTLSFRVAQIAPGFGPGIPYEVTVDVKQP